MLVRFLQLPRLSSFTYVTCLCRANRASTLGLSECRGSLLPPQLFVLKVHVSPSLLDFKFLDQHLSNDMVQILVFFFGSSIKCELTRDDK